MNKSADETARYITVILPVNGSTDTSSISAKFIDSGYFESSASVEVSVNGETHTLSYTL